MKNKREQGSYGEKLAEKYYKEHGRSCLEMNYTIRGGEIDCIVENTTTRCFIEVKVVNTIFDFFGYITKRKISSLKRTMYRYNYQFPTHKYLRIDVVFIQQNRIVNVFENITL